MYKKEKPLALKGSTSALNDNLSVRITPEKGVITYAVVHKAVVNVVGVSTDGASVNHRQVVCKEPSATHGATIVIQARLVNMSPRTLLVITSQMGIQMFEADGSLMLYWYALGDVNQVDSQACFGRGICSVGYDTICVGTHEGHILVFNIPTKGTNITIAETLRGHRAAICALESDGNRMASSDDLGNIHIWQAGEAFRQTVKVSGAGFPCTNLGIWNDLLVASYGTGHLRVFSLSTGNMHAEVTAHARWINAIDVSNTGLVLSASEDSYVRVWQLKGGICPEIEHRFSDSVTDLQLQGAKFSSPDGRSFALTGYDSNELISYTQN